MFKKVAGTATLIIIVLLIINLARQISQALNASTRLDTDISEVNRLQDENRTLKQKLAQVESYDYLEQIARNELDLAKQNETIFIIPDSEIDKVLNANKPPIPVVIPNWQLWLKLIFHI